MCFSGQFRQFHPLNFKKKTWQTGKTCWETDKLLSESCGREWEKLHRAVMEKQKDMHT